MNAPSNAERLPGVTPDATRGGTAAAVAATPDEDLSTGAERTRDDCVCTGSDAEKTDTVPVPSESVTFVNGPKDVVVPGRPPAVMATYCRPFTSKVIGAPETSPLRRVCQSRAPVSVFSAKNSRSTVPPKTMPPAKMSQMTRRMTKQRMNSLQTNYLQCQDSQ